STTASNNSPICAGQTLQLFASGTNGTFSWTGPNGFSSTNRNPVISNATTAASGTYSVTRTVSSCSSTAATNHAAGNTVPVCQITGPSVVCSQSSTNIFAGPSGSGLTYGWSVTGNGTISGSNSGQSVAVAAGTTGSLTLSLTLANGSCVSTCSTLVAIT